MDPRKTALGVIAAVGFSAAAAAGEKEYAFDAADGVEVRDFIGAVMIAVDDGAFAARVEEGAKPYAVEVDVRDGKVVVQGPERPKLQEIYKEINWRRDRGEALEKFLKAYPTVKILIPAGAAVAFDDSVVKATGGDLGGALTIDKGLIEAEFGDVKSADIAIHSSGDVLLGDVANLLKASIHGSGDIEAVSAGAVKISIHGSGDVDVGAVKKNADTSIHGSGDVRFANIGAGLTGTIHGSGDIEAGEVAGATRLSIHGSGGIELASVNGPASVSINGNGDIAIDDGRAENLKVMVMGAGDFSFGGVSTNLDANVGGSGEVNIARNEGSLRAVGDGEVFVGGVQKNKKRKDW